MNAAEVFTIAFEAIVILGVTPIVLVAWRAEAHRRRIRRRLANINSALASLTGSLLRLGHAASAARGTFENLAAALAKFEERA